MANNRNSPLRIIPTILLLLLPLVALNIGGVKLREAASERTRQERTNIGERILEYLSSSCEFSSQMEFAAGRFRSRMNDIYRENFPAETRKMLLKTARREVFTPPFPQHKLFVMEFDPSDSGITPKPVIFPKRTSFGNRAFCIALKHLVLNSMADNEFARKSNSGEKILKTLFGKNINTEILMGYRLGKCVPAVQNSDRIYFLWDYITDVTGKPQAGFFLYCDNNQEVENAGFRLALKNAPNDSAALNSAFIRFHHSLSGNFIKYPHDRSPQFALKINGYLKANDHFSLEKNPARVIQLETSAGDIFLRIIPDSSHLAATMLPLEANNRYGRMINIINILFAALIILVATRGWLLGRWPKIRLTGKFTGLYFLAAAFPLISVIFLGGIYINERADSLLMKLQRDLKAELMSIDLGKDSFQGKIQSIFNRVIRDPEIMKRLESMDSTSDCIEQISERYFSALGRNFPVPLIAVFDAKGRHWIRSGAHVSEKTHGKILSFFRSATVRTLSRLLYGQNPPAGVEYPLSREDDILLDTYEGASGIRIENTFAEYRQQITNFAAGEESISEIHENISVKGENYIAIMFLWRNMDFAELALKDAFEKFLHKYPTGSFMAFRQIRGSFQALMKPTRHIFQLEKLLDSRGGIAEEFSSHDENERILSLVMPSRRNPDEIYACSVSTKNIFTEINQKKYRYIIIFVIWLLSCGAILAFSARRIIYPITGLTGALKEVAQGNLDLEMKLERADELGQLSDTFNLMIGGLRRRRRLASVVSQKAKDDLFVDGASGEVKPYRTNAVVLVSDIRNFTTICENQLAHEVTSLLNRHFDLMSAVITGYGGRIDKFIGDAIQSIFEERESDGNASAAERAFRAGISMLEQLDLINLERKKQNLFTYSIGVGLAHGLIIIGGFGDRQIRFDYSVMGAPLKEAMFLESLSKEVPHFPLVAGYAVYERIAAIFPQLVAIPGRDLQAYAFPTRFSPATFTNELSI